MAARALNLHPMVTCADASSLDVHDSVVPSTGHQRPLLSSICANHAYARRRTARCAFHHSLRCLLQSSDLQTSTSGRRHRDGRLPSMLHANPRTRLYATGARACRVRDGKHGPLALYRRRSPRYRENAVFNLEGGESERGCGPELVVASRWKPQVCYRISGRLRRSKNTMVACLGTDRACTVSKWTVCGWDNKDLLQVLKW